MRLLNTRGSSIIAIGLLAAALGVGGALAAGGLSISPGIFKHAARPGGLGSVKISNTTRAPMTIRLAVRPWVQSRGGAVSPNRRRTLGKVRFHPRSFRLAAGATRRVGISLKRRPARRSLFGAIEVTGAPKKRRGGKGKRRRRQGVKIAYRLVTSLRLYPPKGARRRGARAGRLIKRGNTRRGKLLLAVRNTGNTIVPIGATVRISGRGHTLRGDAAAKAIVPGATVNLRLVRLRGSLPRGRYNVTVRLSQGGRPIRTVRRRAVYLR